ncbi:DNA polymerase III subunit beta [Geminocystis sp.]|uniref:DNA polymerase III subunit beta n=1 Tax=Geminocystis sp. TaxID=2664100 RepID=UPI0035941D9F
MKIVCSQIDLKNSLSLVSRAVPSRPTHPILGNVLLVAEKGKNQVTLTGFDLTLGMRSSFTAEVEERGTITLPAKLLNDIIGHLPEGEVSFSFDEEELDDNPMVAINSLSGKFQLRGVRGDEYPELPTIDTDDKFLLPVTALKEGLKGALFSASSDETKQVLTGLHLTREVDGLEFAATDGHRLAVAKISEETETDNSSNFALTIPSRALRELEKMMANSSADDFVSLYVDEGQIVFELDNQSLTSRRLDGAYPNYNQLIPKTFERFMVVDRKMLINSLERVSVFADGKNNMVKFNLIANTNELILSVEARELGNAKEAVNVEITGDDFQIGFNIKYLMDGLKAINSDNIKFSLNGATQPVIINPLSGVDMTYLIMPVQIKE